MDEHQAARTAAEAATDPAIPTWLQVVGSGAGAWLAKHVWDKRPRSPTTAALNRVVETLTELKAGQEARAEDMKRIERKIDEHIQFHLNHPKGA